ncbi:MAG: c-type cytochrome [Bacteroidetes bacterium]|nr:MAG: c-type cytochrome [Bacteroidota bacterium]
MKNLVRITIWLILPLLPVQLLAQGEQLFKAKCNTCHLVDKNSTGPHLKGAKQKWIDAGEGDLIYEWVRNPQGLVASGKSSMAAKADAYSPTAMTPQNLKNEEIDAILDYIDNYTPPAPAATAASGGDAPVTIVPNYKDNLNIFYALITGTFLLLIAILLLSNSIISLVKSEYFKEKIKEREANGGLKTLLVIVTFGLMTFGNDALAMKWGATQGAPEGTPWLLVESSDIYLLLTINIILLGVVLYLRNMFNHFMRMTKDEKQVQEEPSAIQNINRVLTDAVPIEEEEKIMLHHEYDGIRELDNNLPPWWVWGFFATIVFAFVYLFNYHIIGVSDLQIEAYNKEVKQAEIDVKAYLEKMAMNVDETSATMLTDAKDLSAGKSIFNANCVTCHNPAGEGNIGPNLTDKNWIYGFDIKEIFKTIKKGTPKGMPEHASKLNPVQIQQVSSYVLNLPEAKGKEPEGDIIEK